MWNRVRYTAAESRFGDFPLGIALAAGFAAAAVGCVPASLVSQPHEPTPRLVALALVVAGFAAACRNLTANLLTAGIAWSMYLGFLVGHAGELSWHGGVDLLRLGTLVIAALLGSARWLIADLAARWSASVPLPREELAVVVRGPFTGRGGTATSTPGRVDRPQADLGNRRDG